MQEIYTLCQTREKDALSIKREESNIPLMGGRCCAELAWLAATTSNLGLSQIGFFLRKIKGTVVMRFFFNNVEENY